MTQPIQPPSFPYNHHASAAAQAPLPFVRGELRFHGDHLPKGWFSLLAQIVVAGGRPLVARLDTDSAHMAHFFRLNWPAAADDEDSYDLRIVVGCKSAAAYSLPDEDDTRIVVSSDGRCARMTGAGYYTKLKTTIRVLCSLISPTENIFLHGCGIDLGGRGLLLCGPSGSGKTTLARALMQQFGPSAKIVNDDWGSLSLTDFSSPYTGETNLHMKYSSASFLAPSLVIDPGIYASECFEGDVQDPRARLMVPRGHVYGAARISSGTTVAHVCVVSRHDPDAPIVRRLSSEDGSAFVGPARPAPSGVRHAFLDAAYLVDRLPEPHRQAETHRRLLASGRCLSINNSGRPGDVADRLLQDLMVAS